MVPRTTMSNRFKPVCEQLGVELAELEDWVCCGATAAHSLNSRLATALPARNLGLTKQQGCDQLFAPCPMCSMQLLKANRSLSQHDVRSQMSEIVELEVDDSVQVINLIEVLRSSALESISDRVKTPLTDCRPACYYGCLLTRPPHVVQFDDPEHPTSMEEMLRLWAQQPVSWNYRTECCGAGMTLANESTVLELSHKILCGCPRPWGELSGRRLPDVPREPGHETRGDNRRFDTRHDMEVYYLSDLWAWPSGWRQTLGVDRHFVRAERIRNAELAVFTCWCGENISRTVDVQQVADDAGRARRGLLAGIQVHV